jgi:hypothetical protein
MRARKSTSPTNFEKLFESPQWKFIRTEHQKARFADKKELKKHPQKAQRTM